MCDEVMVEILYLRILLSIYSDAIYEGARLALSACEKFGGGAIPFRAECLTPIWPLLEDLEVPSGSGSAVWVDVIIILDPYGSSRLGLPPENKNRACKRISF